MFTTSSFAHRKRPRSLRIAVVFVFVVVIVIFVFAFAFVFLFVFFLSWLLAKEDIGSYRPIRRVFDWDGVRNLASLKRSQHNAFHVLDGDRVIRFPHSPP